MKTKIWIGSIAVCMIITACSSNQEHSRVKKEIKLEMVDGKDHLTVTTTIDDKTTTETFEGKEALEKMKELEQEKTESSDGNQKMERDVSVRIDEKGKTVTIRTSDNGKKSEEVYTGKDADKKLKELEAEGDEK